ncbi:MAG: hypothetical protein JXR89_12200 [Deltaproteobacteria bacterium]|nr:hypothetical protein [Deltaproteobacteria bacterium]
MAAIYQQVFPTYPFPIDDPDYHYAGHLRNNTNISGQIESMNVWYKRLGGNKEIGRRLTEKCLRQPPG